MQSARLGRDPTGRSARQGTGNPTLDAARRQSESSAEGADANSTPATSLCPRLWVAAVNTGGSEFPRGWMSDPGVGPDEYQAADHGDVERQRAASC